MCTLPVNRDEPIRLCRARFDAAIFDLDGVITRTAKLRARVRKQIFDDYLCSRSDREGKVHALFDAESDYRRCVDGKPRYDGVQRFLESRAITMPRGDPQGPPDRETVCGFGSRKNELFRELLARESVGFDEDAIALVKRLRALGVKTAIVSSSRNRVPILQSVGALDLFDATVDGDDARRRVSKANRPQIASWARPQRLNVTPGRAIVFEDAQAGAAAGYAGRFGLVIGVDRGGQDEALREHGADAVLTDLATLEITN